MQELCLRRGTPILFDNLHIAATSVKQKRAAMLSQNGKAEQSDTISTGQSSARRRGGLHAGARVGTVFYKEQQIGRCSCCWGVAPCCLVYDSALKCLAVSQGCSGAVLENPIGGDGHVIDPSTLSMTQCKTFLNAKRAGLYMSLVSLFFYAGRN